MVKDKKGVKFFLELTINQEYFVNTTQSTTKLDEAIRSSDSDEVVTIIQLQIVGSSSSRSSFSLSGSRWPPDFSLPFQKLLFVNLQSKSVFNTEFSLWINERQLIRGTVDRRRSMSYCSVISWRRLGASGSGSFPAVLSICVCSLFLNMLQYGTRHFCSVQRLA